jgi:hypothetical protein
VLSDGFTLLVGEIITQPLAGTRQASPLAFEIGGAGLGLMLAGRPATPRPPACYDRP